MIVLSSSMLLAVPLAPLVSAIAAGLFGKTIGRRGSLGKTIVIIFSVQGMRQ